MPNCAPSSLRILVVDNDPASRLVAQAMLRSLGHECETARDGIEARDGFRSCPPDVILHLSEPLDRAALRARLIAATALPA